jgi:hypothetical protein
MKGNRMEEFIEFPKITRLSRVCVITEKIDGTNGCIYVGENEEFLVGSRTRWITPDQDNHGFAQWAYDHKDALVAGLGIGRHYGEWWGSGIQRGYGLQKGEKRFSLFNTKRWGEGRDKEKYPEDALPSCCHVVPILRSGIFDTDMVRDALFHLSKDGSMAAPGFMNPEGIVIYHTAANMMFKKTITKDDEPKGTNL